LKLEKGVPLRRIFLYKGASHKFLRGLYFDSIKVPRIMLPIAFILNLLQIDLQQFEYIIITLGIVLFIIILVYIGLSTGKEETE
jgi:hypothetical protein